MSEPLYVRQDARTAEEFLGKIDQFQDFNSVRNRLLWRGLSDSDYSLAPAALRNNSRVRLQAISELDTQSAYEISGDGDVNLIADLRQVYFEYCAICQFYRRANSQGLAVPRMGGRLHSHIIQRTDKSFTELLHKQSAKTFIENWPMPELIPVVALAQHYGVPTRLLDWSDDPKVAAYFACLGALRDVVEKQTSPEKKIAVWMINTSALHLLSHAGYSCLNGEISNTALEVIDVPLYENPNLRAQKGCFTLIRSKSLSATQHTIEAAMRAIVLDFQGAAVNPFVGSDVADQFKRQLVKLTLPQRECVQLQERLRSRNYAASHLFPGYAGVALDIEEEEILQNARKMLR